MCCIQFLYESIYIPIMIEIPNMSTKFMKISTTMYELKFLIIKLQNEILL